MAQERRPVLGAGEHDRMSLDAKARRAVLLDTSQCVTLFDRREPDLLRENASVGTSDGR
jgi:hypothetical protein